MSAGACVGKPAIGRSLCHYQTFLLEKPVKSSFLTHSLSAAVRIAACFALAGTVWSAVQAADKLPEVSSDGLHLVPNTKVRAVYAKPGASLAKYTEVKILDCFVQFADNYQRDYNLNEIGLQGRVSTQDMENIKQKLADEFKKVFTDVLQKDGHPVVDNVGPNVLLLRPAIINLEVTAPDLKTAGMSRTYVTSAGQMTLYMEMYDSATSELLARVIDPQAAERGGMGFQANSVTNKAEADQVLRRWAKLLSTRLGEVSQPVAGE